MVRSRYRKTCLGTCAWPRDAHSHTETKRVPGGASVRGRGHAQAPGGVRQPKGRTSAVVSIMIYRGGPGDRPHPLAPSERRILERRMATRPASSGHKEAS